MGMHTQLPPKECDACKQFVAEHGVRWSMHARLSPQPAIFLSVLGSVSRSLTLYEYILAWKHARDRPLQILDRSSSDESNCLKCQGRNGERVWLSTEMQGICMQGLSLRMRVCTHAWCKMTFFEFACMFSVVLPFYAQSGRRESCNQ